MAGKSRVLYYFTLGMSMLYALLGLFFIFSAYAAEAFPGWRHTGLGVMLIVYAAYRVVRLKKIQQQIENTP